MKNTLSLLFSAFLIFACSSSDSESTEEISQITLPTVSTNEITDITKNTAVSGGTITNNGGSTINAKGVCWSKENSPTITNFVTTDGNGSSEFLSSLSELEANTQYYLRAYATNEKGTSYGNEVNFTTLEEDSIVGVWTEKGKGTVYNNGTEEFSPYDYFCVTLGRFVFESNGTFEISTFDGPDDGCLSTGVLTGTWIKNGELYTLKVISDTSANSEAGQEAELRILFPNDTQMEWVSESDSAEIDYSYELFELVE